MVDFLDHHVDFCQRLPLENIRFYTISGLVLAKKRIPQITPTPQHASEKGPATKTF